MLTLFALVLAIGIVVDDAIVVVEAVHSKMEQTGMPVEHATMHSMSEISGAIISITLVMCAVFIPVGFMQGLQEFSTDSLFFTLAIAILISAVNALTLSPALCVMFLNDPQENMGIMVIKKGFGARFFNAFNASFNSMTRKYIYSLKF